jgi:hypothetical protein
MIDRPPESMIEHRLTGIFPEERLRELAREIDLVKQ